jgi:AcrR family transcriptional regulator
MTQSMTELGSLLPDRPELSTARARLFTTALVLFGERGYHGVSVRDITDALGQKPGAIYAHVQSKQQLLYELALIGHIEHRDRVRAALVAAGDDPVEQITAIVRAHVLAHLDYPALARVSSHEFRFLDEQHVAQVLEVRGEAERMFLHVVDRGRLAGAFVGDEPELAVAAIGAMGVRAAERWTPDSPLTRQHVAETYARFAVNLLR